MNEYKKYYCRTCGKLFNDQTHNAYYTMGGFIGNQHCLINEVPYGNKIIEPRYMANCPHCYSKHTLNVNKILSGECVCKGEKLYESDDKKMLKCLGEWLKYYDTITGYLIVGNVLYSDGSRAKQKIQRMLCKKNKHLNRVNDKLVIEV